MLNWIYKFFSFNKRKLEESVDDISHRLVKFVLDSAFEVFKDDEFRRYFDFNRQKNEEQDRLFNELSLTGLCLLLLTLDDIVSRTYDKIRFWREVRQRTPKMFQSWLKEIGVPRKNISIWSKLIMARCEEYQKDQIEIRREMERHDKEFSAYDNEAAKETYVRFMAIAIGAIHHLRQNKVNPSDPFFSHLRTWLGILNIKLEKEILKN